MSNHVLRGAASGTLCNVPLVVTCRPELVFSTGGTGLLQCGMSWVCCLMLFVYFDMYTTQHRPVPAYIICPTSQTEQQPDRSATISSSSSRSSGVLQRTTAAATSTGSSNSSNPWRLGVAAAAAVAVAAGAAAGAAHAEPLAQLAQAMAAVKIPGEMQEH